MAAAVDPAGGVAMGLHDCWTEKTSAFSLTEVKCKSLQLRLDAAGAEAVRAFLHGKRVKVLKLNKTGLDDRGLETIASAFGTDGNLALTHLELKNNNLSARAVAVLAAQFKHAPLLTKLDVSANPLGDAGVADLMKGLCRCRNLQELNLKDVGLTNDGAERMVDFTDTFTSLNHLDLSCNRIGSSGARCLLQSLRGTCLELQTLKLAFNKIGMDAKDDLIAFAANCNKLEAFTVEDNDLDDDLVGLLTTEVAKHIGQRDADNSLDAYPETAPDADGGAAASSGYRSPTRRASATRPAEAMLASSPSPGPSGDSPLTPSKRRGGVRSATPSPKRPRPTSAAGSPASAASSPAAAAAAASTATVRLTTRMGAALAAPTDAECHRARVAAAAAGLPQPPYGWTVAQLGLWLQKLDIEDAVVGAFASSHFRGTNLASLTVDLLKSLGLALGDALDIIRCRDTLLNEVNQNAP